MQGQIIGGEYQVKELLGDGRFGVVYLCEERALSRPVAVKVLKPEITALRELKRFEQEARRLASLSHPNVVHVHRLGEHEGRPFIVMEYFPSRTFREIPKNPPMSLSRALGIMTQVGRGLTAIHALNIVHGDLSSNNILIGADDSTKIVDLGLARDIARLSTTATEGVVGGTPAYMAPEVIEGQKATFASDIFSFGALLYELVSGRHPFEAEHFMSVLYSIVIKAHPPLKGVMPHVPDTLCQIVDDCLHKDPAQRLVDLDGMTSRLSEILADPDLDEMETETSDATPKVARFRNPYHNRVMIKRAVEFFGRKQEVRRIYARLNATPPGSVSIVGDRKIGKSSLLNYVYMRRNRERLLEKPDSMIMVYVDLQQEKNMSIKSFVDIVLGMANLELRGRLDVSDCSRDLRGVRDLVERLDHRDLRLVLLMDEFEAVTANPNFDLEFFSFLRFLANQYNVGYLTSSTRDLQYLCHAQDIRDSPFFNIFSTMGLSVLQEDEARELIRVPSARVGRPLETYEDKILDMVGLFPFFLQLSCWYCLEFMEENPGRDPDFEEVRRRFYDEARFHYRHMWDSFDLHERSVILRVASGKKITESLRHVCEELGRKHYLERVDDEPSLFSSSFGYFVQSEISGRQSRPGWKRWFRRRDEV